MNTNADTPNTNLAVAQERNRQAAADLNASMDKLIATALRIRRERDDLRAVLRDLIAGADMVAPLFTGAALAYIEEVKRVALAGLQEAGR